jgi:hypothetical protein
MFGLFGVKASRILGSGLVGGAGHASRISLATARQQAMILAPELRGSSQRNGKGFPGMTATQRMVGARPSGKYFARLFDALAEGD